MLSRVVTFAAPTSFAALIICAGDGGRDAETAASGDRAFGGGDDGGGNDDIDGEGDCEGEGDCGDTDNDASGLTTSDTDKPALTFGVEHRSTWMPIC